MDRPKYQIMPDLTAGEYEALKNDIAENGITTPILKDEVGEILDGHNRLRAALELGLSQDEIPEKTLTGLTEQDKLAIAVSANCLRRHLTLAQKREIAATLDEMEMSQHAIARSLGVNQSTVSRWLSTDANASREEIVGLDPQEIKMPRVVETERYCLVEGGLKELALVVEPGTVDAIITEMRPIKSSRGHFSDLSDVDQPRYINSCAAAAELGARVIKPEGCLAIMVDPVLLAPVLDEMTQHLRCVGTLAYLKPNFELTMGRKTFDWRPVIVFCNGEHAVRLNAPRPSKLTWPICDLNDSGDLVEMLTRPAETVLDPFLSRVYGEVLLGGRRFVGCVSGANIDAVRDLCDDIISEDRSMTC